MTFPVRHISQTVQRDPATVASYAEHARWITESPMGVVEVRFVGDVVQGI